MSFMEEGTLTPVFDTRLSEDLKPDIHSSKRKFIQKTVVKVKIEAYGGKQKNEGPPSDFWSWRKYGQKPIKGSPYPRGYYKCSTSKGCSAKKQVERCRTDASLLLITYTSSHNHDLDPQNTQKQLKEAKTKPIQEEIPTSPNQEQQPLNNVATSDEETSDQDHFHYLQSPSNDILIINQLEENPFTIDQLESRHDQLLGLVYDEDPISLMNLSTTIKSEEDNNDHFFDELEELPMFSSSYNNTFMGSSLFDERILLQPS